MVHGAVRVTELTRRERFDLAYVAVWAAGSDSESAHAVRAGDADHQPSPDSSIVLDEPVCRSVALALQSQRSVL